MTKRTPLTESSEWTFDLIDEYYHELEDIAVNKLGLSVYPNSIEIIGSEQMLDAYSSVAMPIMYNHWSFGQQFLNQQNQYQRGYMGLAYEVVINSSPCIAYLMEENTMMMQILVMAHACFGHNAFFKNNYLFKQWTDAETIIDYLVFAKKYIAQCEEKYGPETVEEVLDACHALQLYGVDKYKRPPDLTKEQIRQRDEERKEFRDRHLHELWSTVPVAAETQEPRQTPPFPESPQENVMYFIEKNAPHLEDWKREIIRIVRKISQYFYPQRQTQLMNEGFATFMHYEIVNELYNRGLVSDGFMIEFNISHTNVTNQPDYNSKYYSGINVYALGFAMYRDIKRICMEPTEEDREWFPEFAGNGDWLSTIKWAAENFKDESFILQFLSPKVIRDFHLFRVLDDDRDPKLEITAIHNKAGYKQIRETLSKQYNIGYKIPDIQVSKVKVRGDRSITLEHTMVNRRPLDDENTLEVLKHLRTLWQYDVRLESYDKSENPPTLRAIYTVTENSAGIDKFTDDD